MYVSPMHIVGGPTDSSHPGTWDVMRKQLHSPISIGRAWCVVDFSGSRDQNVIIKFSDDLKIAMAALGKIQTTSFKVDI